VKLRPGLRSKNPVCGSAVVLAGDDVGDHLMSADCILAPFVDGLSTRRGSVVAAFQHGIPVVSTSSIWTDHLLLGQEERSRFSSRRFKTEARGDFCSSTSAPENFRYRIPGELPSRSFIGCILAWPLISCRLLSGRPDVLRTELSV